MKLEEKKSCVYAIYDHNGKVIYVGCSNNYINRYNDHRNKLQNKNHKNNILQKYCDAVGFENLSFVPLFFCNEKELLHNELMFIKILSPLSNIYGINKMNIKLNNNSNIFDKNFNNKDILDWMENEMRENINYSKKSIFDFFVKCEPKITPKKTKMYLDYFCRINNLNITHGNSPSGRTCRISKKITNI